MVIGNPRIRTVSFFVFIFFIVFPIQTFAKTYKTDHFKFSVGWLFQYNEEEKKTIAELVDRLDDIWIKVNELCENELPPKLKMSVKSEGTLSRALRTENKILINSIKIKKGLRDCLTIVAHEATHIGYHKISKGKITKGENNFLDEGIAMYAMWPFEPNMTERKALFLRTAKSDLKNGKASLSYLRDWKKNVDDKLLAFSKKWRSKNPNKIPALEDELKVGVNSYFTSCVLVEYIIDAYGLPKFVSAIRNIGKGESQSEAFQSALGKKIEEIFAEWHNFLDTSN
jgi:hypothetical protein